MIHLGALVSRSISVELILLVDGGLTLLSRSNLSLVFLTVRQLKYQIVGRNAASVLQLDLHGQLILLDHGVNFSNRLGLTVLSGRYYAQCSLSNCILQERQIG